MIGCWTNWIGSDIIYSNLSILKEETSDCDSNSVVQRHLFLQQLKDFITNLFSTPR